MAKSKPPTHRRRGYASGGLYDPIPDIADKDPRTPLSSNSLGSSIMGGAKSVAQIYALTKDAFAKTPGGTPEPSSGPTSKPESKDDPYNYGSARGGKIKRVAGKPIGKDDGLIPAQRGEYVVRKSAVKKLGTPALNQINKGKIPARKGR